MQFVVYKLLFVSLFTFLSIYILKPFASKVGLVDIPCNRKVHTGFVPLIGGLSVFMGVCFAAVIFGWVSAEFTEKVMFLLCITVLVVLGAIDDAKDLSVGIRLIVQTLVTVFFMAGIGMKISYIGHFPLIGAIDIGPFGYFLTIFAVIGAINAFNMVDGIDGLCGSLSVATLLPLALSFYWVGSISSMLLCLIIAAAIVPFLIVNLRLPPINEKIFMGDAGSMMIGFTVVFLLVGGSQGEPEYNAFSAANALWFIAIPLMDMAAIMVRRVRKGLSPFAADRNHLHHIFLHVGFNSRQALYIITLIQVGFSIFGLLTILLRLPDWFVMGSFIAVFALYSFSIQHAWRITKYVRARRLKKYREQCE